jgi:hypothetical protein
MEVADSSEIFVPAYWTIRHDIPQDLNLFTHSSENFKSNSLFYDRTKNYYISIFRLKTFVT